jgi:hypothetical protein
VSGAKTAFFWTAVLSRSLLAILSDFWTEMSTWATETAGLDSEGHQQMKAANVQGCSQFAGETQMKGTNYTVRLPVVPIGANSCRREPALLREIRLATRVRLGQSKETEA